MLLLLLGGIIRGGSGGGGGGAVGVNAIIARSLQQRHSQRSEERDEGR